MQEYGNLGHMKFSCYLEGDKSIENKSFFLPHSAVIKDSITTRCRVVFDASAKSESGVSLKDIIIVGPTIQPTIQDDLYSILMIAFAKIRFERGDQTNVSVHCN